MSMAKNPDLDLSFRRLLLEDIHTVSSEPTSVMYEQVQCPGTVGPAILCQPAGTEPLNANRKSFYTSTAAVT
jgi:hypothetical protein